MLWVESVDNLIPKAMVLRGRNLKRWLGHEGSVFTNGLMSLSWE